MSATVTADAIQNRIREHGFRVFDGRDYDVQLVSVRRRTLAGLFPAQRPGERVFDDLLCAIWYVDGVRQFRAWRGTTDPQGRSQSRADRPHVTVIASPQQARKVWRIGTFAPGKPWEHEALVQIGDFRTWRDFSDDGQLNPGAELHTSPPSSGLCWHGPIGDSLGCQQHATWEGHRESMAICRMQRDHGLGDTFTATIFDWPSDRPLIELVEV